MILLFAELALVLVVSKVHIDQTVAVSGRGFMTDSGLPRKDYPTTCGNDHSGVQAPPRLE